MKIWIVMSQYRQDDDGDWDRNIVSAHSTREGAEANLAEDLEWHERYVTELDILP